jgi:hypothetical protein
MKKFFLKSVKTGLLLARLWWEDMPRTTTYLPIRMGMLSSFFFLNNFENCPVSTSSFVR